MAEYKTTSAGGGGGGGGGEVTQGTAASLKCEPTQTDATKMSARIAQLPRQAATQPTCWAIDGTTKRSALLAPGRYFIKFGTAAFFRQGGSGVNAVISTYAAPAGDYLLDAGEEFGPIVVTGASDGYVAGVTPTGATGVGQAVPE